VSFLLPIYTRMNGDYIWGPSKESFTDPCGGRGLGSQFRKRRSVQQTNYSMHESRPSERLAHLVNKCLRFSCNPNVYYRVHDSPLTLLPILSQNIQFASSLLWMFIIVFTTAPSHCSLSWARLIQFASSLVWTFIGYTSPFHWSLSSARLIQLTSSLF
jgi:hypothetical protein